jgi:hypothetical protein
MIDWFFGRMERDDGTEGGVVQWWSAAVVVLIWFVTN